MRARVVYLEKQEAIDLQEFEKSFNDLISQLRSSGVDSVIVK